MSDSPAQFDATFTVRGRAVQIRYRRGLGENPEFQTERNRAEAAARSGVVDMGQVYSRLAVQAIEAWDQAVPITEEGLSEWSVGALQRIVREAAAGKSG